MKTELGWKMFVIVDRQHLLVSLSGEAHLKHDVLVLRINVALMISGVQRTNDVQRTNVAQKIKGEQKINAAQMKTTIPQRLLTILQLMAYQTLSHRCKEACKVPTLQVMNCLRRLHLQRIQLKKETASERELIMPRRLKRQSENLSGLQGKWMLMKIMMMMEMMKRKEELFLR
jgi:hypothetical protein